MLFFGVFLHESAGTAAKRRTNVSSARLCPQARLPEVAPPIELPRDIWTSFLAYNTTGLGARLMLRSWLTLLGTLSQYIINTRKSFV